MKLQGLLCVAASIAVCSTASAQLYAASGSNGVAGTLFTLDPTNGAVLTTVGPLAQVTGAPVGITGMCFIGNTLYGVTANASPNIRRHLVTINTTTAIVTDIGNLEVNGFAGTMSDITTIGGVLYGWHASGDHSLYTINLGTGAPTLVGNSGLGGAFGGGGLAANAAGQMFASPDANTAPPGSLYSVNPGTGGVTVIGPHTGNTDAFNAMQFVGSDLLAIHANQGAPSLTQLSRINTANGSWVDLGPSANNLDALAYLAPVPEPATMAVLGLGVLAMARRRKASK